MKGRRCAPWVATPRPTGWCARAPQGGARQGVRWQAALTAGGAPGRSSPPRFGDRPRSGTSRFRERRTGGRVGRPRALRATAATRPVVLELPIRQLFGTELRRLRARRPSATPLARLGPRHLRGRRLGPRRRHVASSAPSAAPGRGTATLTSSAQNYYSGAELRSPFVYGEPAAAAAPALSNGPGPSGRPVLCHGEARARPWYVRRADGSPLPLTLASPAAPAPARRRSRTNRAGALPEGSPSPS